MSVVSDKRSCLAVLLAGWTGPLACLLCAAYKSQLGESGLLAVGLSCLLGCVFFVVLMRDPRKKFEPLYPIFSICTFSSCVDVLIGFESDGWIKGWVDFYLDDGEPYLKTAYGAMINYWDFFGHYSMYLVILYCIAFGGPVRDAALFWFGSIFHSLIVFLPGNVLGPHEVKLSYLLNVPYVLVPLYVLHRMLVENRQKVYLKAKKRLSVQCAVWWRPFDLFLVLYLLISLIVAFWRGFAALDCHLAPFQFYRDNVEPYMKDPVFYPKLQILVYLFYFSLVYGLMLYGLLLPGCSWIPDIAVIHAGAAAQAQVSHVGGAINWKIGDQFRTPPAFQHVFWAVNIFLLVGPMIFAARVLLKPHFFLGHVPPSDERKKR